MAKFKATTEDQKLLNEDQFREVFMEYLEVMDSFDATIKNQMERMKSLRYHVDTGVDEHPELCKKLFREYEELKIDGKGEEKNRKLA